MTELAATGNLTTRPRFTIVYGSTDTGYERLDVLRRFFDTDAGAVVETATRMIMAATAKPVEPRRHTFGRSRHQQAPAADPLETAIRTVINHEDDQFGLEFDPETTAAVTAADLTGQYPDHETARIAALGIFGARHHAWKQRTAPQ